MAVKKYSLKKQGNLALSKNFKVKEFACKDGDTILIDSDLITYLQKIRDHFGKPVRITSGYRTVAYNAKIGGATGSYHTKGQAADSVISGVKPDDIAKYAESLGCLGIGSYNDDMFNHIDTRKIKFYWRNQSCTAVSTFGGGKTTKPTLKKGVVNVDWVKKLQTALNTKNKSGLKVDGDFGAKTDIAVKAYQKAKGLLVDGIVGNKTWAALGL
ncbi:hypothetical protein SDC9_131078 [bioreactor metagenome]|uniref:Murein endopeptidase K n=1 Tax=bioreactor metagenome TaxID=1076179 RepID=A0A645D4L8_9ZZZZ